MRTRTAQLPPNASRVAGCVLTLVTATVTWTIAGGHRERRPLLTARYSKSPAVIGPGTMTRVREAVVVESRRTSNTWPRTLWLLQAPLAPAATISHVRAPRPRAPRIVCDRSRQRWQYPFNVQGVRSGYRAPRGDG